MLPFTMNWPNGMGVPALTVHAQRALFGGAWSLFLHVQGLLVQFARKRSSLGLSARYFLHGHFSKDSKQLNERRRTPMGTSKSGN